MRGRGRGGDRSQDFRKGNIVAVERVYTGRSVLLLDPSYAESAVDRFSTPLCEAHSAFRTFAASTSIVPDYTRPDPNATEPYPISNVL